MSVTPLRAGTLYQLIRSTVAILAPACRAVSTVLDALTLNLSSPLLSLVAISTALWLAFLPSWIAPLVLVLLLRSLAWHWLYTRQLGGRPEVIDAEWRLLTIRAAVAASQPVSTSQRVQAAAGGAIKSALAAINPMQLVAPLLQRRSSEAEVEKAKEAAALEPSEVQALDRILRPHIAAAASLFGVRWDDATSDYVRRVWTKLLALGNEAWDAVTGSGAKERSAALAKALVAGLVWCFLYPQWLVIVIMVAAFMILAYALFNFDRQQRYAVMKAVDEQ